MPWMTQIDSRRLRRSPARPGRPGKVSAVSVDDRRLPPTRCRGNSHRGVIHSSPIFGSRLASLLAITCTGSDGPRRCGFPGKRLSALPVPLTTDVRPECPPLSPQSPLCCPSDLNTADTGRLAFHTVGATARLHCCVRRHYGAVSPAGLLPHWLFRSFQVHQSGVVGTDDRPVTQNIRSELPQALDDCQLLFPRGTIHFLGRGQSSTGVRDDA